MQSRACGFFTGNLISVFLLYLHILKYYFYKSKIELKAR